jgi:hypothetical protein
VPPFYIRRSVIMSLFPIFCDPRYCHPDDNYHGNNASAVNNYHHCVMEKIA